VNPTVTQTSCGDPALLQNKVLILGLGNDLLADDAVGLNVVREIRGLLLRSDPIDLLESSEMGLALLDYMVGFEVLILVDAVQTGLATPGFLHEWDVGHLKVLPTGSPHFLGVGEVVALGRKLGLAVPRLVRVFAVEVQDPFTVRIGMTQPLRAALESVSMRVLEVARQSAV
jgi:hydrogenase maturation protease